MASGSPETLFIGNHIVRLGEVDSTNTFTMGLLRGADIAEGAVVTAKIQTSGRGQRGNSWFSEPGKNITCSILLKPVFLGVTRQFDLTRAVALGISDLLTDLLPGTQVHIKWPNDIIADGKKVAGILIENIVNGEQLSASVVGIGMNVNQSNFGGDAPHAISVFQLTGKEFEIENAMQHLFSHIEARYLQLRAGQNAKLREDYHARLFKLGVMSRYTDFKTIFDATLENISEEGMLCLRDGDGLERRFGFKEVGLLY
jgi:BirA family biotin operon repressor/biotin-[acetyl-CoA-carboxylase] ligase